MASDQEDPCVAWLAAQAAAVVPGATITVTRSPRGYYAIEIEGRPGPIRVDARWLADCMERDETGRVRWQIREHLDEADA